MQPFIILTLAILLFCAIVLLVFGAIFFKLVCFSKSKSVKKVIREGGESSLAPYAEEIKKGMSKIAEIEKEEVTIKSFDNLNLHAVLLKGEDEGRTIICVHGYHSEAARDFSLAVEPLLKRGNLLMIDQRSHGKSEGKFITFGVHESKDCKAWADWLSNRMGPEHSIYFDGVSMGGTSVLLASCLELPSNVRGIIADCSFTSPYDIINTLSQRIFRKPPRLLISCIDLYCKIFARFSLKEISTPAAMKKNTRPILFAHGKNDNLVPYQMTQAAYDAFDGKKFLILADGADHGLSFLYENKKYSDAITDLFEYCEKK